MGEDSRAKHQGPAVDDGPDPLVGQVLNDRFEVVAPLARGGMGKVYRAIQRPLGRQVALKVLDIRGVMSPRGDFQRRFFLEAATAAKLTHPNTVVVYDYGLAGQDVFFIAMELIDGRTLAQELREHGPMDAARVAHIGKQICGSLAEAHAHGVVHRDLKPSNVLLTKRGADSDFVKVLDFGLVKVVGDDDDHEHTASGVMMGTPRYMSPEQVTGKDVTTRSDVYSLGTVLFHALAGKPPFDGESKFDIFTHHVSSPPRPLREVYPLYAAPARLERVVMKCLAKDPMQRWSSMEEVDRELSEVLREVKGNPAAFGVSSLVSTMPRLPAVGPITATTEVSRPQHVSVQATAPLPAQTSSPAVPVAFVAPPPPVSVQLTAPLPPVSVQLPAPMTPVQAFPSGDAAVPGTSPQPFAEPVPEGHTRTTHTSVTYKAPPRSRPQRAFPWSVVILLVIVLGASGTYWWMFARDGRADPLGLIRSENVHTSPLQGGPTTSIPVVTPPVVNVVQQQSGPPPVVIQCVQPNVRMAREGQDLGDCGAPLPIPPGQSWVIDLTAPGYEPRTIVLYSAQGIVPVALAPIVHRPAPGSHGGHGDTHPSGGHHGGDVRDPWAQ